MKRMPLSAIVALTLTLFFGNVMAEEPYDKLQTPQPTVNGEKIEVVEVFSYYCPHCNAFHPKISAWAKKQEQDVEFVYLPVGFGRGTWELAARAFYTAQVLGVAKQGHEGVFNRIHKDNKPFRSVEEFAEYYAQFGVKQEDFIAAFKSFAVDSKMRRSQQLARGYGIDSVPALVVNGKFRVGSTKAGGFDGMLKVADDLIAAERAEKTKK